MTSHGYDVTRLWRKLAPPRKFCAYVTGHSVLIYGWSQHET